jgi:hypothetical protein
MVCSFASGSGHGCGLMDDGEARLRVELRERRFVVGSFRM